MEWQEVKLRDGGVGWFPTGLSMSAWIYTLEGGGGWDGTVRTDEGLYGYIAHDLDDVKAWAEATLNGGKAPAPPQLEWSRVGGREAPNAVAERYVASSNGCDCEVYRRSGESTWWLHVMFYHGSMYASRFKSLQAAQAKAPKMVEWAAEAASWRA